MKNLSRVATNLNLVYTYCIGAVVYQKTKILSVAASAGSSGFQKGCKAFPGINRSNRIYDDFVVHAVYYVKYDDLTVITFPVYDEILSLIHISEPTRPY